MQKQNPAKVYLNRYRTLVLRTKAIRRAIDGLREQATDITVHMDPNKVMSSAKIHDPMAEAAAIIADHERRLLQLIAENDRVMAEIEAVIRQVPDGMQQDLLWYRYICFMRWTDIASEMHYEERHIYRLHGLALQEVNRILVKLSADVSSCQSMSVNVST